MSGAASRGERQFLIMGRISQGLLQNRPPPPPLVLFRISVLLDEISSCELMKQLEEIGPSPSSWLSWGPGVEVWKQICAA